MHEVIGHGRGSMVATMSKSPSGAAKGVMARAPVLSSWF